jgi:hypothetical protein
MTALLAFVPWWVWAAAGVLLALLAYGWLQRKRGADTAKAEMRAESAEEYARKTEAMNEADAVAPRTRGDVADRLRDKSRPF